MLEATFSGWKDIETNDVGIRERTPEIQADAAVVGIDQERQQIAVRGQGNWARWMARTSISVTARARR